MTDTKKQYQALDRMLAEQTAKEIADLEQQAAQLHASSAEEKARLDRLDARYVRLRQEYMAEFLSNNFVRPATGNDFMVVAGSLQEHMEAFDKQWLNLPITGPGAARHPLFYAMTLDDAVQWVHENGEEGKWYLWKDWQLTVRAPFVKVEHVDW